MNAAGREPGTLFNPGWFRVLRGQHAGEIRLSSWFLSAIQTYDGSWVGIATCPLCGALVLNNENKPEAMISPEIRRHERWHAANDAPIPPELTTN